jgi:hypothetical protein
MILIVWAASNLLLLALQGLGLGVGFGVHPLSEDREMIRLMANYQGLDMCGQFWRTLESRNPLAPWLYQAFSPLIFLRPEGLYLLRKLVDLFIATSVYLLVNQISRAKLPKFAFACGVFVLFWNFSGYIEQIMWIPLIAFGLSTLSVYFYCRYLDSGRATADYLVISLLLFFIALATYSIQCGVPIAVFLLGLFRRQETAKGRRFSSAVWGATKDAFFFGALFVLFIQVWITTSADVMNRNKYLGSQLEPGLFLNRFLRSISNLVWHFDTTYLIRSLNQHWPIWLVAASVGVGTILFYWLFVVFAKKAASPPTAGSSSVPHLDLVLVLAVFCALVAPTALLETTTATWFPGSRSRMVQQGFQPVLYLSFFFLLTEYLFRKTARAVEYVRNLGIALLCALAAVFGLEYNRALSEQTTFERKLETGLKEILPALGKPTHFVVKMKGMKSGVWYSGVNVLMQNLFVETAYNSNSAWLDPVYEGEPTTSKSVTFGSDQRGIYSPASDGWIPYQDVVLLEFDGEKMTRLTSIDRETFSGYGALYAREKPFAAGF